MFQILSNIRPVFTGLIAVFGLISLSACGPAEIPTGIDDPYEAQNRGVHDDNRALDRALVRPGANAYGSVVPEPVRNGVGNFASNLSLPSVVVNDILQLKLDDALKNTLRFAVNSTFGLGGVLDPATDMGLYEETTDFGETLHVWGVPEGNYVELPIVGPTTERDMVGKVVDLFTNPLTYNLPSPENTIPTVASIASRFGDRYRFSDTVDSILYESADSYAQARLLYLQNRRFDLGGGEISESEGEDIFEELYGE